MLYNLIMSIIGNSEKSLNYVKSDLKEEDQDPLLLSDDSVKSQEGALVKVAQSEAEKVSGDGLSQYIAQISKFPILTSEQEFELASRVKNFGDKEAAQKLVQSHLRLVIKMASKYRNYGLPVTDLISEGNLGLIRAVKKYNPDQGFRFSTYAMWWIRANIQEYVLKSWSLVKIATTKAQKKLFFNLKKIKRRIGHYDDSYALSDDQIEQISSDLDVKKEDVTNIDSRISGSDMSLNNKINDDVDAEVIDVLVCEDENQEQKAIALQERQHKERLLKQAFMALNDREKDILIKRQMSEVSSTLEDLSKDYKVSRERVRQIEAAAMNKIRVEIKKLQEI